MFTGIITHLGEVKKLTRTGENAELVIVSKLAPKLSPGDSLAVNGACLTVASSNSGATTHHLMVETLTKANLGQLEENEPVNLELPLSANQHLDGHFVTGHIDGVCEITAITATGQDKVFSFSPPSALLPLIVAKGSVALDGVSLTVASLHADYFTVSMFPYTLKNTKFGTVKTGYLANIEVDILGKYVQRLLNNR